MITGIDRPVEHLAGTVDATDAVTPAEPAHFDGTVTAPLDELRRALAAALPHAGTDPTFPELCAVLVEPGRVWATDRFTLALDTFTVIDGSGDFRVRVGVADVKAILAAHKGRAGAITLDAADGVLTVRSPLAVTRHELHDHYGTRGQWRSSMHRTAQRLLEDIWPAPDVTFPDGMPLNWPHLAKLAKAARPGECLRFWFTARTRRDGRTAPGAAKVAAGEHFRCLIMPARVDY